jgi:LPXTG-site transpeptidase (sortase) family protein
MRPVSTATSRQGPTHIDIPAIGVSADVGSLGLTPKGYVQVPADAHAVGWYEGSVVPGAPGASVLLGHTSRTGHAVFNRLHELRAGDTIAVDRADAAIVRYVVDRVASFNRTRFPTTQVYGPSSSPVLRLVTCAGLHDGRFTDNLIVFAHLEASA